MSDTERTPLSLVSRLTSILMCLVVTAVGIKYLVLRPTAASGTSAAASSVATAPAPVPPALKVGDVLPSAGQFNPARSGATLVLVLSTECQFCTDSMPFYSRLTQMQAVRNGRLHVSVASLQAEDAMRGHLDGHGVKVPTIVRIVDTALRISATPTLFLVGADGHIASIWNGRLRPDQEKELQEAIAKMASF